MVRLFTASVLALSLSSWAAGATPADGSTEPGGAAGAVPAGPEAQPRRVQARAGSHDAFGRVVFDWPTRVDYQAEVSDGRLMLRFDAPFVPALRGLQMPRNVVSVAAVEGGVAIAMRPGARVRHFRLGNRIVIDVHDATSAVAALPAETRRAERRRAAPVPVASAPAQPAVAPAPEADPAAPAVVADTTAPAIAERPAPVEVAAAQPVPVEIAAPVAEAAAAPEMPAAEPALATPTAAPDQETSVHTDVPAIEVTAAEPLPEPVAVVAERAEATEPATEVAEVAVAPAIEPEAPVAAAEAPVALVEATAVAMPFPVAVDLAEAPIPEREALAEPAAQAIAASEAEPVATAAIAIFTTAPSDAIPPAVVPLTAEVPVAPEAEAPSIVVGDLGDQPEMPLSSALTTPEPIGENVARAEPPPAASGPAERVAQASPPAQPAASEAPSAAPQPIVTERQQGGPKVEEAPAPVIVAVPPAPAPAPAAPAGQVVLVQQQPALPGGAGSPLQLAPSTTRIQVAPGQPIPPLLGGAPATPVAPALSGPLPSDQRPALVPVPVILEVGSGRLIQLPAPAAAVFAADPRVARVQPASPTSLFVMAVAGGRTNVIATGDDGTPIVEYDVTVAGRAIAAPTQAPSFAGAAPAAASGPPRASAVESMIRRSIRGGEGVRVGALGQRGYVLSGLVPTAADAQRAEAIAKAMGGEAMEVVNNLSLLSAIQVNVRVRVAEISRQVTRELGFNWQALGNSSNWLFG